MFTHRHTQNNVPGLFQEPGCSCEQEVRFLCPPRLGTECVSENVLAQHLTFLTRELAGKGVGFSSPSYPCPHACTLDETWLAISGGGIAARRSASLPLEHALLTRTSGWKCKASHGSPRLLENQMIRFYLVWESLFVCFSFIF